MDLAAARPEALKPASELLAKTVFGISETWYIELSGGGEQHVFDLEISSRTGPRSGIIYIAHVFDAGGRMLDMASLGGTGVSSGGISVRELELSSKVTVALKVEPEKTPLRVDARLDGKTAIKSVYLGAALDNPGTIPFTIDRRKGVTIPPEIPADRPDGPYFLIWRSGKSLGEPTVFELGESIENELRSVGYLQ